jgi:sugar phosphate isomerase/epimerase
MQFMPEVVIVASAFGVDAVRRTGHAHWLDTAAAAGAAAFEVRRELFASDDDVSPAALRALGAAIAARGMWTVYSTPSALYAPGGVLDVAALEHAFAEAGALGARFVKLQLGGFAGRAYGAELARFTPRHPRVRLVVENGLMKVGGSLAQFTALFAALRAEGRAQVLGMTFDIGNWLWPGEVPLDAARKLAAHVEYIHCKSVRGSGARRFAAAPAADDPLVAAVLPLLPRDVPRGIEYPLDPSRLAADALQHVAWLAAA